MRMCPGIAMPNASGVQQRRINGAYGIEYLDPHTLETVALSGFNIEGPVMYIAHTTQGKRPTNFSTSSVRNRLGRSDFRIDMMNTMIEIAKKLKLTEIKGIPAALVESVNIGLVNYDFVAQRVDNIYELFGFEFGSDCYFRYQL